MTMTRRRFLKASGATGALTGLFSMQPAEARASNLRPRIFWAKQSTTICPYCACGCGQIVSVTGGEVINIEGDPDHPINEGSLCSKGSALYQVANNKRRLTHVMHRAAGSNRWQKKSWNWAINRITQLAKKTRDTELAKKGKGIARVDSIAALGGAALDNEECYLYSKLMRALGVVYIEHQARI
jgi:formate dehydrogenase major subunit